MRDLSEKRLKIEIRKRKGRGKRKNVRFMVFIGSFVYKLDSLRADLNACRLSMHNVLMVITLLRAR